MTLSDLIAGLAACFIHLTAEDAEIAAREILGTIADSLTQADRVELSCFGSFRLDCCPPRTDRNPKNGDPASVPAKYVPHFRAGKKMRERIEESAKPVSFQRADCLRLI